MEKDYHIKKNLGNFVDMTMRGFFEMGAKK